MVLQCALQVWTFTAALLWRGVTSEEWGQTGTLSLASLMTHETIYHIYINWIRTPNGPAPCLPGRGSIKHLGTLFKQLLLVLHFAKNIFVPVLCHYPGDNNGSMICLSTHLCATVPFQISRAC